MVDRVAGHYYEAGSSRRAPAELILQPLEAFEVSLAGEAVRFEKGSYLVEPPLGGLKRVVHFKKPEGDCYFETEDQVGFRQIESQLTTGKAWHAVSWLESHWKGTLISVVLLVFFGYGFIAWGLPALARKVAADMPQSWRSAMTRESVELMEDMGFLEPSELDDEQRARMQEIFAEALALSSADRESFSYELRVMGSERMGANAFAFPSGLIVATDDFVALCETDAQALAVFLHEITHVEEQHGIRALIQRGGVFLVLSILVGDASSVVSLAESFPALVLNAQYSQRFELECDTFAANALQRAGFGAGSMREILIRLHKDSPEIPVATFLSSHPSLKARVENIERIEAQGEGRVP